jgi:flavin-dependent dehydrogenase
MDSTGMRLQRVSVIGAGPAGLAAAIELARAGVAVTVYEQHAAPGARFQGDFQGLENWTSEEDVLCALERQGNVINFPYRPTSQITVATADLARVDIRSDRPLAYLVKRGREEDSLDSRLAAQAAARGVTFQFKSRVHPEELRGPVIVATGPHGTQGIAAGIVARTSHPDQVVAIVSDALAPKGYAYCVIWAGRATLATVLMRDFPRAWACLDEARAAFARLGLSDFREARRFGGRVHVSGTDRLIEGRRLFVGEAAGLQDYLFGFGLRYALVSGHLAARALLTGERYDALVERHLRRSLQAGFVNRYLFDRLGDRGHARLIRWLAGGGDALRRVRRLYTFSPAHRMAWPLVTTQAAFYRHTPRTPHSTASA